MLNPQILGFGLLGLVGIGRKIYTIFGSNPVASHLAAAVAGATSMGVLDEAGYSPLPHMKTLAKMAIKAGEKLVEAFGEPEK